MTFPQSCAKPLFTVTLGKHSSTGEDTKGMRIEEQDFSAKVELPCKIFCGPDSMLEFSGVAVNINTGSLLLQLGLHNGPWQPVVGEKVRLELSLPVNVELAKAKSLSVRARVANVTDMPDGSQRLELRFRKPSFKDSGKIEEPIKAAGNGWEM
jgi:hypothetical protein